MKFNQEKTKVIYHTKIKTEGNIDKLEDMEVVHKNKMLGTILDSHLNNAG